MPRRLCQFCNKLQMVPADEFKYLDHDGDYVCSRECIMEWLRRNRQEKVWFDRTQFEIHPSLDPISHQHKFDDGDFRSKYEYHVANWLVENSIAFKFEPFTIEFDTKSYLPDFFLSDYGVFLEVKGKWGVSQKKKLAHFRKVLPDLKVLVIPWTLRGEFYGDD